MRYLKSQLLVWLFGGLVGAIFLIVYFVFETPFDRESTRWMLWAGLVITVADVLIALAVANYAAKSAAKTAALEQHGELALAHVLVDPATNDFQVDWERSALVNGLMPAQFTLADDNVTYDLSGQAEPLMAILQILKANNIPLTSPLDLHSANLELRHRLQDVVRRAAAARPSPAFASGPPRQSASQRLQELAGLHANEAITDDEYAEKRRQIISEI